MRILILSLPLLALTACMPPVNRTPVTPLSVAAIEPARYLGKWYEIARLPNQFENDCEGVTAEYGARADGKISVINTCHSGGPGGAPRQAKGSARIVDAASNAKLKVSFFGPFEGDYWVLDHAPDYSWSIVGEPRGRYLWILSRTAQIAPALRADLIERVRARGYSVDALHWTQQAPA